MSASSSTLPVPSISCGQLFRPLYSPAADVFVQQHPNGIALVSLAPRHALLQSALTLTSISFPPHLSALAISGKRKRGAPNIEAHTQVWTLCWVGWHPPWHCLNGPLSR